MDATASHPLDLHYSKLHFMLESANEGSYAETKIASPFYSVVRFALVAFVYPKAFYATWSEGLVILTSVFYAAFCITFSVFSR